MSASPDPAHELHPSQRAQRDVSTEHDSEWEDDDDMEFEPAEEETEDDMDDSELDDIEYHGEQGRLYPLV